MYCSLVSTVLLSYEARRTAVDASVPKHALARQPASPTSTVSPCAQTGYLLRNGQLHGMCSVTSPQPAPLRFEIWRTAQCFIQHHLLLRRGRAERTSSRIDASAAKADGFQRNAIVPCWPSLPDGSSGTWQLRRTRAMGIDPSCAGERSGPHVDSWSSRLTQRTDALCHVSARSHSLNLPCESKP